MWPFGYRKGFWIFLKFHDHFNPTRPVHIGVENNAGIN